MIITGVFDGPLSGGTPKAVEFYVINNIPDLSIYGFGSANNGNGGGLVEFTFPANAATAGSFLYLSTTTTEFTNYFGFAPHFINSAASINGDDAVELFLNGVAVDVFGDINMDGTGTTWDYEDGWAYRNNSGTPSTSFNTSNWTFSGTNVNDNQTSNASAPTPFPIGTYSHTAILTTQVKFVGTSTTVSEDIGTVTLNLSILNPNANPTAVNVSLATSGSATDGTDFTFTNPTTVTFPANSTSNQTVSLNIIDDAVTEFAETIVLKLSNPTNGATIGSDSIFTITINASDILTPDIVINEIFYNVPSTDSLEFVELYNNEGVAVDLSGYTFSDGVTYTFPNITLNAGEYLVICNNAAAFYNAFGITAYQWTSGSLNNSGEAIEIKDANGLTVDSVYYGTSKPWTDLADGNGNSLALCDPTLDNNNVNNWFPETTFSNLVINGQSVFASPNAPNGAICSTVKHRDIEWITSVDTTTGVVDSLGKTVQIQGFVYGVNLRATGLEFTVIDAMGHGIGVFSASNNYGYTVTEGDYILLKGTVGQFNGLAQLTATSLTFLSGGHTLLDAEVVTDLNEDTESALIQLEDVFIIDPTQWTGTGSGFNVNITNGIDTFIMRIDNMVDLYGMAVPSDTFNVTGIGGQFDNSNPYTSGYQIFPRYVGDIDPYEVTIIPIFYPSYDIASVTTNDVNGVADSLGVKCSLNGIVHGIDMQGGAGLNFTMIDNTGGINVFSATDVSGYVVNQSDKIIVKGTIAQFNGLTQIVVDSLIFVSTGNTISDPAVVTALSEATESEVVVIQNVTLVDVNSWNTTGASFNANFTDGTNTYSVRIDSDVNIAGTTPFDLATSVLNISGIGGQFDNSNPFTEGYQLLPRYSADIEVLDNTKKETWENKIQLFPNPVSEKLYINTTVKVSDVYVYNNLGQLIKTFHDINGFFVMDMQDLISGVYSVQFVNDNEVIIKQVIKQ